MNELLLRRRVASAKPYDSEIEYLESSGTQWINPDVPFVYANDIIDIEVNIAITSNGTRQLNGANGYLFWGISNSGAFEAQQTDLRSYDSNFHTWKIHCQTGQRMKVTLDNITYQVGANVDKRTQTFYLMLFALGATRIDRASFFISEKLKSAIIKKNNVTVRDFVAVRKGTTGYLYDKVSGTLFGNAGTGNFILGPDK